MLTCLKFLWGLVEHELHLDPNAKPVKVFIVSPKITSSSLSYLRADYHK
jgi:hypothetical protein